MPLLIAVLLGLSGLIVVIYPLLGLERQSSDAAAGAPMNEVAEREQSARDALREVEFDHRLGNLDDADYEALRARYERRALSALKSRYQREQELDALIEQQLDDLRARLAHDAPVQPKKKVAQSVPDISHNGTRPATGPQTRRRRGGRG
jgi:hypothetical protein